MHMCLCMFMCGGLPRPSKQYVAIRLMTSANDASSESGLNNRLIDYVTVFMLVTIAVHQFPLSQEKMKRRIVCWPAPQLLLYMCRKWVPSFRRLLLAANQTFRTVFRLSTRWQYSRFQWSSVSLAVSDPNFPLASLAKWECIAQLYHCPTIEPLLLDLF